MMERLLEDILPILGVENNCILSKQGDVTVAYKVELPEIFTLSDQEYEAFHQTWIKAIKILPKHCVFHKQDWFVETTYEADFSKDLLFLSRSSERFFNERFHLDHKCYILITKRTGNRKAVTSLLSSLLRKSIVPEQGMNMQVLQEFFDSCSQFERILNDSGYVQLKRLKEEALLSQPEKRGLIEGQNGISVEEAYRFLHNRWMEKQLLAKRKQIDVSKVEDQSDGNAKAGSGKNLLQKKRRNKNNKKI